MGSTTNRNSGSNLDAVAQLRASPPANAAEARATVERELTRIETETAALPAAAAFTNETLAQKLTNWRDTVNTIGPFIDNLLARDAPLTARLRTAYFAAIEAALTKGVAGQTRPQLLKRHNLALTWWARQHFQTARRKIVFITGPNSDDFYDAAKGFFNHQKAHGSPSLQIDSSHTDLESILGFLRSQTGPDDLPWGEVNIVTHAHVYGHMNLKAQAANADGAGIEQLQALSPVDETVLDSASKVFIRGCSVGRSDDFLQAFQTAVGRSHPQNDLEFPHVWAPKHIQEYRYTGSQSNPTTAAEAFLEFWYVGYPSAPTKNARAQAALFQARFPNETVNWLRLLGQASGHKSETNQNTITSDGVWTKPSAARKVAFLRELLRAAEHSRDGISGVTISSETPQADGFIELNFRFQQDGQTWNWPAIVLPPLPDSAAISEFVRKYSPGVIRDLAHLENHAGLTAADFAWSKTMGNVAGFSFQKNMTIRYGRTNVRVHRYLTDPRGSASAGARVAPNVDERSHYGYFAPPVYQPPATPPA